MLYTIKEAAREAQVSEKTIRRLVMAGRLLALDYGTKGQRNLRIPKEALLAVVVPLAIAEAKGTPPRARRRRSRQAASSGRPSVHPPA